MSSRRDRSREEALDECIDVLLAGGAWEGVLPAEEQVRREVSGLMAVAQQLLRFARATAAPAAEQRVRVWRRVRDGRSLIRRIAFYRLPYLPPLWIRPEANAV